MDTDALDPEQRRQLLQLARDAIGHRLTGGEHPLERDQFHPRLHRPGASFVTLHLEARLRGCIGNLAASRPLLEDVAHNAAAAAFEDPRFEPLTLAEYQEVTLQISVLGAPRPLAVKSRAELIERLRPGIDGLVLQQGGRRATYLPSVWEQLPDADHFIGELRRKAGLPRAGWSDDVQVSVYQTCEFN